jgi:SET domain-containing protein
MSGKSLAVKSSSIHGRGVFATRAFEPNEILEEGSLLVIDQTENDLPSAVADSYSFEFAGELRCLALGSVSLCNHSPSANAEMFIEHRAQTYQLVCLRHIAKGAEILLDYGAEYWDDLGVEAL